MTKEKFEEKGDRLCDTINNTTNWGIMLFFVLLAIIEDNFHLMEMYIKYISKMTYSIFKYDFTPNVCEFVHRCWIKLLDSIAALDSTIAGILVAIMVVLWTFTVSLCVNCLEKVDGRYYGAPIGGCLEKYGIDKLLILFFIEFGQMILMVFSVIFQWRFTLVITCFVQLYTIPAIFCIVMFKTSRRKVLEYIQEEGAEVFSGQKKLIEASMFSSMIRNMDYKKKEDMEKLENILINISVFGDSTYGNTVDVADLIIESIDDIDILWELLKKWFRNVNSLEIRLGIVSSILGKFEEKGLQYCTMLIDMCERDIYQRVCIWIIVHELYWSRVVGEQWRIHNVSHIKNYYLKLDSDEKINIALKYWEQLTGSKDNIYIMHEFINSQ